MASTPATAASSERRGQGLGWFMLLAVVVAFVPAASAPGSAPEHQFVGMLGHGDALFWDGPYIESVGTGTRLSDEFACHSPAATMIGCDVVTGTRNPPPSRLTSEPCSSSRMTTRSATPSTCV